MGTPSARATTAIINQTSRLKAFCRLSQETEKASVERGNLTGHVTLKDLVSIQDIKDSRGPQRGGRGCVLVRVTVAVM